MWGFAASSWLKRFAASESGSISAWSLFLFLAGGAIAAVAVDVTHLTAARTELQVSADLAAHAALFRRNQGNTTATTARNDAIRAVQFSMPTSVYGPVIEAEDITFGTYDRTTDIFSVDASSRSAVLVRTSREEESENATPSFFFRLVGIDQFDVSAAAVMETYQPGCLNVGFTAEGMVDLQSGSNFLRKFCVHSNSVVKLGNGNFFEAGTVVSMPEPSDIQIGGSGFTQNPGLREALRQAEYEIRILDRIRPGSTDALDTALLTPGSQDRPSYISRSSAVVPLGTGGNVGYSSMTAFTEGRVHTRFCNSSSDTLTISGPSGGSVFRNIVLITNCQLRLSGQVRLENAVLFTTHTSDTSVSVNTAGGGGGSSDGLYVGRNDNCSVGNGAQIITRGGFRNSAALYLYGAQVITLGPVQFSSNATGDGASIISGSTISGTSNLSFSGCDTGMEQNFTSAYFRLAR